MGHAPVVDAEPGVGPPDCKQVGLGRGRVDGVEADSQAPAAPEAPRRCRAVLPAHDIHQAERAALRLPPVDLPHCTEPSLVSSGQHGLDEQMSAGGGADGLCEWEP